MKDSQATQVEGLICFLHTCLFTEHYRRGKGACRRGGSPQERLEPSNQSFQTLLWAQGWVGVPST